MVKYGEVGMVEYAEFQWMLRENRKAHLRFGLATDFCSTSAKSQSISPDVQLDRQC